MVANASRVRSNWVDSGTSSRRRAISSMAGIATSRVIASSETTGNRARGGASSAGSNSRSS